MRSTNGDKSADLTAKARIRDAALRLFAREGFGVSARRIAAAAAVSPGLIIHHFGSKQGLRTACDEYVGRVVVELKTATMAAPADSVEANMMHQLISIKEYEYVLGYLLNSVNSGGPAARAFIGTMAAATADVLERGVAAGTIRPSRDPEGRAQFITCSSLGSLLVWAAVRSAESAVPADSAAPNDSGACTGSTEAANSGMPDTNEYLADFAIATLELYTEGLFTDSSVLDAYLAASAETPTLDPSPPPASPRAPGPPSAA
jgi:AcrR family transcriptional regulator